MFVVFVIGGLLQVHPCAAFTREVSIAFFSGHIAAVVSSGQVVIGGKAKTIQFPHISLIGLGSFAPTEYGQKHIAIPNPKVSVGTIYNLNCDHGIPILAAKFNAIELVGLFNV
jgi:hypothetical protein